MSTAPNRIRASVPMRTAARTTAVAATQALGSTRSVSPSRPQAGITKNAGPHTLRHAFMTAALDAGVPLLDVQEAASHADLRTTMRYDRARTSLDRHAPYIVVAYVAGVPR